MSDCRRDGGNVGEGTYNVKKENRSQWMQKARASGRKQRRVMKSSLSRGKKVIDLKFKGTEKIYNKNI